MVCPGDRSGKEEVIAHLFIFGWKIRTYYVFYATRGVVPSSYSRWLLNPLQLALSKFVNALLVACAFAMQTFTRVVLVFSYVMEIACCLIDG